MDSRGSQDNPSGLTNPRTRVRIAASPVDFRKDYLRKNVPEHYQDYQEYYRIPDIIIAAFSSSLWLLSGFSIFGMGFGFGGSCQVPVLAPLLVLFWAVQFQLLWPFPSHRIRTGFQHRSIRHNTLLSRQVISHFCAPDDPLGIGHFYPWSIACDSNFFQCQVFATHNMDKHTVTIGNIL